MGGGSKQIKRWVAGQRNMVASPACPGPQGTCITKPLILSYAPVSPFVQYPGSPILSHALSAHPLYLLGASFCEGPPQACDGPGTAPGRGFRSLEPQSVGTMSQVQEDMATLIFDIAHECLDSFDRVVAENDEALLTRSFAPVNTGSIPDSRRRSSFDFLGLRNSFLFWADYTGALSLMNSSLDARLSGFTDVSDMVAELLEMILRNLHQGGLFTQPSCCFAKPLKYWPAQ